MPWREPEYEGEFPTLGYVVGQWIQDFCVVPDRDLRGRPFILTDEQLRFLVFHYALTPDGGWVYPRGSQIIRPQGWGKGPLAAAWVCAEAAGPALFDGWDASGEPVGRPWATPHIQITACSEDQTDNTWRALQPMIELGELGASFIHDTGKTRINLPGGGIIEPVTASHRSRLGQRITAAVQDQSESWVQSNHGIALADNQRRGLAKMGGRFLETGNAPDPVENSVAWRTPREPGVFIDDVDGGPGSVRNKEERRRVLRRVYGDALTERGGWVPLERVEVECDAKLIEDAAQAERWFMNRKVASEGSAFDFERVKELVGGKRPKSGSYVVLGVDGARHDDALAVVATDVRSGHQWPVIVIERPDGAPADYEHDLDAAFGAVADLIDGDRYTVWRAYCDDQYIQSLLERWENRYGTKRFVRWHTNRPKPIAYAVRRFEQAIAAGDVSFDGNPVLMAHLRNSRKRLLTVLDDKQRQMHTLSKDHIRSPRKIDAAMAAVLSWEARGDAIAAGVHLYDAQSEPVKPAPEPYRKDFAPDVLALTAGWSGSDME